MIPDRNSDTLQTYSLVCPDTPVCLPADLYGFGRGTPHRPCSLELTRRSREDCLGYLSGVHLFLQAYTVIGAWAEGSLHLNIQARPNSKGKKRQAMKTKVARMSLYQYRGQKGGGASEQSIRPEVRIHGSWC